MNLLLFTNRVSQNDGCCVESWSKESEGFFIHSLENDMNECTTSESSDDFSTSETLLGDKDIHIEQSLCSDHRVEIDLESDFEPETCSRRIYGNLHPGNRLRLVEGRVQVVGFAANATTIPPDPRLSRRIFWDQVLFYVTK